MADDLLCAAFDRDPPASPVAPTLSYLICSTPRSGSTLLTEALRATGALATPAEYFNTEATVVPLGLRWGSVDRNDYVRDLYRYRTTPQGIFGSKLHWEQVEEWKAWVNRDSSGSAVGPCTAWQMLERWFPRARYVHVSRRDIERQAVSYWIAEHTRQWSVHRGEEPNPCPPPTYSRHGIDRFRTRIEHGEARWARFFVESGIEPLHVVYEDFVAHYAETVVAVAAHVGIRLEPAQVPPPRLRRQSDDQSEDLVERYRSDRRRSSRDTATR